ncbi:MAG TPA: glycosyltransferase 87 family protein [Candidatus Limnocylindrales bacterium]|nr:glycosyltransferase 87 family protein [Candidatus Limnocylindrales bacterium]
MRVRQWQWLIYVLMTGVSVALFFRLAIPHKFFDLDIYRHAVRWWAGGHELYDYAQPDFLQGFLYFTYPPFAAILLVPFGFVPLGVAGAIFTIGSVAAIFFTTKWLFEAERLRFSLLAIAFVAVPLIVLIEPMRENIMLGQINMVLITLIVFDLLKLDRWKGVGVGLATALKLFPGIFIVYFLVTRQWRAAIVSSATAAGATLLAAAISPRASWEFWTQALWDTARVGRTDYTGNQSLLGLLSRLVAPAEPDRVIWVVLAVAVGVFGLFRAQRATRAGDIVTAMALTGLVAGLISPITWPHHLYWFVPALISVFAGALDRGFRSPLWFLLIGGYLVSVLGVVSLVNWGVAAVPTDTPWLFLERNAFVLLSCVLLIFTPIRHYSTHHEDSTDLSDLGHSSSLEA